MPKPSDIVTAVAALMNDQGLNNNNTPTKYTNTAVLPYLNLALDELQELYELNGISKTTNETSPAITIKSGVNKIGFDTTPALPSDLVDIQQIWESTTGLNQWTPMIFKDVIPHYLEDGTTISMFLIWGWDHGRVKLVAANADNDIKIDYVSSMFNTPILIKDINVNLPFTNIKTYLEYATAALCAMFVAENPTRATALDSKAGTALSRSLGIPIKGMQSTTTRRRPFRHSFKHRGVSY